MKSSVLELEVAETGKIIDNSLRSHALLAYATTNIESANVTNDGSCSTLVSRSMNTIGINFTTGFFYGHICLGTRTTEGRDVEMGQL